MIRTKNNAKKEHQPLLLSTAPLVHEELSVIGDNLYLLRVHKRGHLVNGGDIGQLCVYVPCQRRSSSTAAEPALLTCACGSFTMNDSISTQDRISSALRRATGFKGAHVDNIVFRDWKARVLVVVSAINEEILAIFNAKEKPVAIAGFPDSPASGTEAGDSGGKDKDSPLNDAFIRAWNFVHWDLLTLLFLSTSGPTATLVKNHVAKICEKLLQRDATTTRRRWRTSPRTNGSRGDWERMMIQLNSSATWMTTTHSSKTCKTPSRTGAFRLSLCAYSH